MIINYIVGSSYDRGFGADVFSVVDVVVQVPNMESM